MRGLGRNLYVQLRHLRPYQPRSLYHQPTGNDCPRVPDAVKQEARFALDWPLEEPVTSEPVSEKPRFSLLAGKIQGSSFSRASEYS
jgi:hypothetical protein